MGLFVITEFRSQGRSVQPTANVAAAQLPKVAEQSLTITSTASVPFAVLNAATRLVRIRSDVACFFASSTAAVTASSTCTPLGAGQTEYFGVTPGLFISAIGST